MHERVVAQIKHDSTDFSPDLLCDSSLSAGAVLNLHYKKSLDISLVASVSRHHSYNTGSLLTDVLSLSFMLVFCNKIVQLLLLQRLVPGSVCLPLSCFGWPH